MACGLLFARLRPIHEKVSVLRRRLLGSRITLAWTTCAKRVVQGEAHFYRPDMEFALRLLRRNGFQPNAVIDVGAYKGDWALLCRGVFSDARVLMVEPSAERMRGLRKLRANVAGLDVRQALLGAREDMLLFREQESNSGVVPVPEPGAVPLACTPLDVLVATTAFAQPELLRLDVQGYELQGLEGAVSTLRSVEVLVIELSLIPLNPMVPSLRMMIEC